MQTGELKREVREELRMDGRRFALVVSRFNPEITEELLEGARDCLLSHGTTEDDLEVYRVPGAWELPQAVRRVVDRESFDAVVGLGCVIRGETPHFDYICDEASRGLGEVARSSPVPVLFGVLTTDTEEQARVRADRTGVNKGWEAARAALEMVRLYDRIG